MAQGNQNFLLQVDHSDRQIGLVEKKDAHIKGILHRAFSIFIFRKVYPRRPETLNFDSARQSQIEAQHSERRSPFPEGKGEEEDRFGKVAASQNSKFQADGGIESTFELLLQQRAFHKYHSGGLWTNTCCSHAEPDVPIEFTAIHRLEKEMGFSCPITSLGSFYYKLDVGNGMIEHEIDHVFAGFYNPPNIHLNLEEANAFKWMNIKDLENSLQIKRDEFTAWFPQAFELALTFL